MFEIIFKNLHSIQQTFSLLSLSRDPSRLNSVSFTVVFFFKSFGLPFYSSSPFVRKTVSDVRDKL